MLIIWVPVECVIINDDVVPVSGIVYILDVVKEVVSVNWVAVDIPDNDNPIFFVLSVLSAQKHNVVNSLLDSVCVLDVSIGCPVVDDIYVYDATKLLSIIKSPEERVLLKNIEIVVPNWIR